MMVHFPYKVLLIIMLVAIVFLLMYRIFDMGITITYLEDDLIFTQQRIKILEKYQRRECSSIKSVSDDIIVIEKNNLIVINGVAFDCREEGLTERKILYAID